MAPNLRTQKFLQFDSILQKMNQITVPLTFQHRVKVKRQ